MVFNMIYSYFANIGTLKFALQCSNWYTSVTNQYINALSVLADSLHFVEDNIELYRTISYYKYMLWNIF